MRVIDRRVFSIPGLSALRMTGQALTELPRRIGWVSLSHTVHHNS